MDQLIINEKQHMQKIKIQLVKSLIFYEPTDNHFIHIKMTHNMENRIINNINLYVCIKFDEYQNVYLCVFTQ